MHQKWDCQNIILEMLQKILHFTCISILVWYLYNERSGKRMNDPKTLTPEFRLLTDIFGPKAAVTDTGEVAFAINEAVRLKIQEV